MKSTHIQRPTARPSGLLTEKVGNETVIYDLGTKDVHCLNPLAAAVFEHCDGRLTHAQIAELAAEQLGTPITTDEVDAAVAQLGERGLLDASPVVVQHGGGHTRRQFAQRSAAVAGVAAFAAPMISTVAARAAGTFGSIIPSGCGGCGQNKDCADNHCCQSVSGKQCNQGCCVQHDNSCHISGTGACTVLLDVEADCLDVSCPPGHAKCCCCCLASDIAKGCPDCRLTDPTACP